jgi:hypothetical protein
LSHIDLGLSRLCDIITLSETFLNDNSNYDALKLPGFKELNFRNRINRTGGGVGLFLKNHIIAHRRRDLELPNLEAMWHELKVSNNTVLLCVCYRPPDSGVIFWDDLNTSLDLAKENMIQNIILIGDLNADPNTFHGQKLMHFSSSNNMFINVHEPTRITQNSSTILDQILTNSSHLISEVTIEPPISTNDHCTVIACVSLQTKTDPPYSRLIWEYNKGDIHGLKQCLRSTDWNSCFTSGNPDEVARAWTETFINCARQYIPNKMVTIRPKDKPWYNNELRRLKRQVIRTYNTAKSRNNDYFWNKYRDLNNQYHEKVQLAKSNFESKRNELLKTSCKIQPKLWWKTVKQLLGYAQDTSIPTIEHNNVVITDSIGKAEAFNSFFVSHSNIDTSNASLPDETSEDNNNTLETLNVTEEDVYQILKSLDTNKAIGLDGVSPKLLKLCAEEIVPSLTRLFNLSLQSGIFPESWKHANVMPLYKKGNSKDINNYRPVSLLSCISKVFERAVFKHVFNFLRDNKIFTLHQSGFLPGDSTVHQLVFLYNYFAEALDKKKDIQIVFCDISKAFDRVWHLGLEYKLKRAGIDGTLLLWFRNYLCNRKQRVVINGQHSSWNNIRAGVPQGSVLGPLLFLIYINDIVENVTGNIKLFADDTVLYIDVDNTETGERVLNADLEALHQWSDQWLVKFNCKKTTAMKMSLRKKALPNPVLILNNEQLAVVNTCKHLGLHFNNKLNWRDHVTCIVAKASKQIDVMKKLKYHLDRKTLETIYISFVRPMLEYGSIVWDNCDKECKIMIEKVQLDAARIVTGGIKGTSHESLYVETGWQPLSERRKTQKLLMYHKMIHGAAPEYLCELVPPRVGEINRYNTRNAENYSQIRCRTEQYRSSFLPDVIHSWNSLPMDIRIIEDFQTFKRKLKDCLPRPNPLFYHGSRHENIALSRMRMNCSLLKDHLYRLHVIDSPLCRCQTANETSEHYLMRCPFYAIQRNKLFTNISQILKIPASNLTFDMMLDGHSDFDINTNLMLIQFVQDYIRETKRFDE